MKNFNFRAGLVGVVFVLLTSLQALLAQTATQTFNTVGSQTFTVPTGVTSITVQAWGGGGGARGDGTARRGGGGGGAYASSVITVIPGQTYTVVVGAGGVATANPGQTGQSSIFGSNLVVAAGGVGGTNSGGAGGTVGNSTGTIRFAGGTGGNRGSNGGGGGGGSAFTNANGNNGVNGGSSLGGAGGTGTGNGGNGGDEFNAGNDGVAPGGGGGGRGDSNSGASGKGANGRVVVSWASVTAELAVTKTANISSPTVGKAVSFTITVTNNGPASAANVVATDLLPTGYTFIGATLSPSTSTYDSANGTWTIGNLASGASVTMVLVGVVNASGVYNNTATVTANNPDSNTANNSATVTVTVCKAGSSSPFVNE